MTTEITTYPDGRRVTVHFDTGAAYNSRNYSAAGQFTCIGEHGYLARTNASGNAKQRRRRIREWKRNGWKVLQHRATGRWSSEVTDKER